MSEIRKLKVYYKSADGSSVPMILLKGKWLEKYGFSTGSYIVPREPDKRPSLEERIENLTRAQKKKLSKVLDEMGA